MAIKSIKRQVSEPDIAQILKLLDKKFKITTINMLRALVVKVDNM